MPNLLIQIKKKTDGSAALTCRRSDGSVTWQRQDGQQGRFFPLHDLTHYAVETVLGFSQGFFGLVADGWDLTDFDKPWPRGQLPDQAILTEFIVGFLDIERASGAVSSATDLCEAAVSFSRQRGVAITCDITDRDLVRIRQARGNLFAQWAALPEGESLDLPFG